MTDIKQTSTTDLIIELGRRFPTGKVATRREWIAKACKIIPMRALQRIAHIMIDLQAHRAQHKVDQMRQHYSGRGKPVPVILPSVNSEGGYPRNDLTLVAGGIEKVELGKQRSLGKIWEAAGINALVDPADPRLSRKLGLVGGELDTAVEMRDGEVVRVWPLSAVDPKARLKTVKKL